MDEALRSACPRAAAAGADDLGHRDPGAVASRDRRRREGGCQRSARDRRDRRHGELDPAHPWWWCRRSIPWSRVRSSGASGAQAEAQAEPGAGVSPGGQQEPAGEQHAEVPLQGILDGIAQRAVAHGVAGDEIAKAEGEHPQAQTDRRSAKGPPRRGREA